MHKLPSGKSSSMAGRTRGANDLLIANAARRPGPGTYDPDAPARHLRGGAMGNDKERDRSLPSLAPGPGAYHQTPTIHQELEMKQLSKQVVRLVKNRQAAARSAPEEGMGTQGGLDDLMQSGMALGAKLSPIKGSRGPPPALLEESPYA